MVSFHCSSFHPVGVISNNTGEGGARDIESRYARRSSAGESRRQGAGSNARRPYGRLACAAAVAYVIRHCARPCAAVVPVGRREPPFYERNAVAPNRGAVLVPREHRRLSPLATNGSSSVRTGRPSQASSRPSSVLRNCRARRDASRPEQYASCRTRPFGGHNLPRRPRAANHIGANARDVVVEGSGEGAGGAESREQ